MRNLIRFILKYQNVFLFLLLEVIAFSLLINHNAYQGAAFFNFSTSITGRFHQQVDGITHYFELNGENELLQNENAKLKAQLYGTYSSDTATVQLFEDSTQNYIILPAKVVSLTTANRSNYAVINIGRRDSITAGMGVISDRGVVGVVKAISERFAVVMPIINHNYRVSSKLLNSNYFGSLSWDGTNYRIAQLGAIEKHVNITANDSIVTTGFSQTFPEGILVGTVKDFSIDPNEDFYNIDVNIASNFKTISSVYVIKMKHKQELETLMEEETND